MNKFICGTWCFFFGHVWSRMKFAHEPYMCLRCGAPKKKFPHQYNG